MPRTGEIAWLIPKLIYEWSSFISSSGGTNQQNKQRHRGASTPGLLVADSIADFLSNMITHQLLAERACFIE